MIDYQPVQVGSKTGANQPTIHQLADVLGLFAVEGHKAPARPAVAPLTGIPPTHQTGRGRGSAGGLGTEW